VLFILRLLVAEAWSILPGATPPYITQPSENQQIEKNNSGLICLAPLLETYFPRKAAKAQRGTQRYTENRREIVDKELPFNENDFSNSRVWWKFKCAN
jgi:hypothetical protein